MAFRNAKVARLAAGAAIVGAAGVTGAVAVAQTGPSGVHYGDEAGQYGATAYGHRIHCPSYRGMERSKGHAKCHEAPRSDEFKAGDHDEQDEAKAPEQDARVMDLNATKESTTTTERRSDFDEHATTTSTEVKSLQATQPAATQDDSKAGEDCDHAKTGTTEATKPAAATQTQAQQADSGDDTRDGGTTWQSRDGDHRDARTDGYHRDGDRDGRSHEGRH